MKRKHLPHPNDTTDISQPRQSSCPSLPGTTNIDCEIATSESDAILVRLTETSGRRY